MGAVAIWRCTTASDADFIDERGAAVGQAMLTATDVRPGDDVLELDCGPGGVGIAAAEIVGAEGHVVLSDVAPEMTAIAAERAAALGLDNVAVRQFDMEHMDAPDGSFDKALCREALMLVSDPIAAARETLRVLRPGCAAAFSVWGPATANPWLSVAARGRRHPARCSCQSLRPACRAPSRCPITAHSRVS